MCANSTREGGKPSSPELAEIGQSVYEKRMENWDVWQGDEMVVSTNIHVSYSREQKIMVRLAVE
ncbi:hypothetical protein T265_01120 [Opisthorchis viverrini]|uniref:Uncharacterized protein n=1 Tax=Opisthorchis viverrini TaxID=6198 RepID=A0A074ZZE3_OPIVI|nr:hypothetical protein T265_01120 [Opisthorchis viverrini]KER32823.1 hypothetical protein T265_01120 [Opisthorchis viverrini]